MQEPDEMAANLFPAAAAHPPSSTSTDTVCIDSLELPRVISMNVNDIISIYLFYPHTSVSATETP